MKTKVKKCLLIVVLVFGMVITFEKNKVEAVEDANSLEEVNKKEKIDFDNQSDSRWTIWDWEKGKFGTVPWKWEKETQTLIFGSGTFPSTDMLSNIQSQIEVNIFGSTEKRIKKIMFTEPVVANEDSSYLFYNLSGLEMIENAHLLDTSNVIDMNHMFESSNSLTKLDLNNWDTSNVVNMRGMFELSTSLIELDVSDWDTRKVTNMNTMFWNAKKLEKIDVSNWDTGNVKDMGYMFNSTSNLSELDVSNWDTSNVTGMHYMFEGASKLVKLDVSNWDTSNVIGMQYMFAATSLAELDVSNWNTSNVREMSSIFSEARKLVKLDVSSWDTSKAVSMYGMFKHAESLTELDVSNWDTKNVTDMRYMFYYTSNLTDLDVSNWDTGNVDRMNNMFEDAKKLTKLSAGNWNTSKVTDMSYMFSCTGLVELDVSNWNISNVVYATRMFGGAFSLKKLDVSNWDMSKLRKSSMLSGTYSLNTLCLGEKNSLSNSNIPEKKDSEYTGRWVLSDGSNTYESSKIFTSTYDGSRPGIYVREKTIDPTKVSGVTITPEKISLAIGKSKLLYPVISPETAVNKKVTYKSSDVTVAKVLSNGKVQAVGTGTATITATTDDGGFIATSTVTVN